ncbi:MAG: integrase/recombinase XerC [Micromonosporaceae bacterium]|jgi:site-specific recombinase XerD|nr:integrase/recombinase XerC [Micromonosporaceae bacterium]
MQPTPPDDLRQSFVQRSVRRKVRDRTAPRTTPLDRQIASFGRWLRFSNKSDNTITIYVGAARKFGVTLIEQGVTDWADVEPTHVQEFIIGILDTRTAGYASNLFRSLQQFSKWYATEEDAPNPMAGMKPPMLPEPETPVLREAALKALLKSCEGKEFTQRRDAAIIYLFLDSGIRRAELAGVQVDDVDLDHRRSPSGVVALRAAGSPERLRAGFRPRREGAATRDRHGFP